MRNRQSGFTMIELIMVIVILGILAAIAMPRFVDLSSEAKETTFQGVRGAAASAMAINYAACAAKGHTAGAKCVTVDNCSDVANLLQGGLPTGYSSADIVAVTTNGTEFNCTLAIAGYTPTGATVFVGIAAGNP